MMNISWRIPSDLELKILKNIQMKKVALLALLCIAMSIVAQKESQWRGANRDGIYSETGLLKSWSAQGPVKLWLHEGLGEGYSSASVANGKIYVTGMIDSIGYISVLDLNGKLLNKVKYGKEWTKSYPGTRGSVTVNDGCLYVVAGTGRVVCFDENTLKVLWKKDFKSNFNTQIVMWGIAESSLIEGNTLIIVPGSDDASMVALNKKTGDVLWKSKADLGNTSYNSPMLVKGHGDPMVVVMGGKYTVGVDLATGKERFSFPYENNRKIHPNTPLYDDGYLLLNNGYGYGSVMLKIAPDGNSVKEIWKKAEYDNQMGGFVKIGDYVYCSGHNNKYWFCFDWKTGVEKYRDKTFAPGNIISADGLLYIYTDKGELALVKPNPAKFDLISQTKVTDGTNQHWAHLVIANKVLYVRHGDALIAYSLK